MILFDYHVHSTFSCDAETKMEDMILAAINLGVKELAFTEHIDFDYPTLYNGQYPFVLDIKNYIKDFTYLKNKYANNISLILGIEVGLQPHLKQKIDEFLASYPFEFIIASTHVVDKLDLHEGDFFIDKTKKEAYRRYFEDLYENINIYNCFNVYGHMDYINRYGNFADKTLDFKEYQIYYEQIFKTLINNGHGIEVNTSGFRYGLNQMHPQIPALKFYKELGGEIITFGSDAHKSDDICHNFNIAVNCIKQAGFKYITLAKGRTVKI